MLMNTRRNTRIGVTALTIAMLAGAPASALAQSDRPATTRRASVKAHENLGTYRFVKSSVLTGAEVFNYNDENIGTVTDLIIDRGSGQITQAVIESGAILGMGGKSIAVPFNRLKWDNAEQQFALDMTQERIDRAVEFDPEAWPNLDHTTWTEQIERWWSGADDTPRPYADPWSQSVSEARTERLEGLITDVVRHDVDGNQQVTVRVKTGGGQVHDLLLGPSWFVAGSQAAPMRDDPIKATFATVVRNGDRYNIVSSATIDGKRLTLRDSQGIASWDLPSSSQANTNNASGRFMLMSDLVGARASSASDKDAGEIQNVVIEQNSARVAILGFDPNENFLGLGDEIKCVPWSVASVAPNGTVRIDATDEALSNCEPMPEQLTVLTTESGLSPVYSVFAVPVERFERRSGDNRRTQQSSATTPGHQKRDARSRDTGFFKVFSEGQKIELEGEIEAITSRTLGDASPMRIIKISTDQGSREIVVGPEWYMANQDMPLRKGDRVSVSARKASVEGRTYYAATSITTPDREFAVWNDSEPVWNDG